MKVIDYLAECGRGGVYGLFGKKVRLPGQSEPYYYRVVRGDGGSVELHFSRYFESDEIIPVNNLDQIYAFLHSEIVE
ncbi:MAG: hypothetical protein ACTSUF_05425 [Candidatus Heimdallarchaeaceae archaeon]